ncbi:PREDICTED: MAR-binding filament-like protein 1-1 isoform X2 [Lupinus angustifolius]|uniref:MAR-binding filament-like protein 1-1 isoform X2 n=1 Tax=Lupinus angustifolius TaxID=3871 RepID=UPI00092E3D41|nr:PREDICTED: MAR-binding filament-like protein 1-1 isoform X2 [Lupinus angustifolius]
MVYVAGSSCFLHSPSYPLPCSSSSSSFPPLYNPHTKFRTSLSIASSSIHKQQKQDTNNDVGLTFCNKRSILLMGISVIPFLSFKAKAVEDLSTKEREMKDTPSNPFLSLLNVIGTFSIGTLGAFYALARKENTTALATIKTVSSKLKEKEELVVSLKRNYESELLKEHEERTKQLGKAKEEQLALVSKLNSANNTIASLEREVKSGAQLIEELNLQIRTLESKLSKTDADKKDLEKQLKEKVDSIEVLQEKINQLNIDLKDKEDLHRKLSSSIEEKELELRNLISTYNQTKEDSSNAQLQIQRLKEELLKSREELEAKDYSVNELSSRISSLALENDDSKRKYDAVEKEYNDLRFTSEKKAASDANLLREKQDEISLLKDQLEHALSEARRNEVTIADLTQERENLKVSLENESKKVDNLKDELQITQDSLVKSRNEAAVLEKELKDSNKLQKELEFEVSKLSSELSEVRESLQKSLDDAKRETEVLTSELTTTKEQLKKTQEELENVSNELKVTIENRDSLQREVNEIYKKAEAAAEDLKEEKRLVASLNKDLHVLENEFSKDKEAQKSLEKHQEEATKSLDEMNRNAAIQSTQLENAISLISSLKNEKEALNKSLLDQTNASKEAQESIEHAQNLIKKLGDEKESLENRGNQLVEELSVAKGEILRLTSQINSSKVDIDNIQVQKDEVESERKVHKDEVENENKVATSLKKDGERKVSANVQKTSRRRKAK